MTDQELDELRKIEKYQYKIYSQEKQKANALGDAWCSTLRRIEKEEQRRKMRDEILAEMAKEEK